MNRLFKPVLAAFSAMAIGMSLLPEAPAVELSPMAQISVSDSGPTNLTISYSAGHKDVVKARLSRIAEIDYESVNYPVFDITIDSNKIVLLSAIPGIERVEKTLKANDMDPVEYKSIERNPLYYEDRAAPADMNVCAAQNTVTSDLSQAEAAWNSEKAYGEGQVVGVISDSFNIKAGMADDIKNGWLPGTGNPCGYTQEIEILHEGGTSGSDEGRAMAQLVHGVAPKAKIMFASSGGSPAVMADRIREMVDKGATVISDDLTFSDESAFQLAYLDEASKYAEEKGVLVTTSAGNYTASDRDMNVISGWKSTEWRSAQCPSWVGAPAGADCLNFDPFGTQAWDTLKFASDDGNPVSATAAMWIAESTYNDGQYEMRFYDKNNQCITHKDKNGDVCGISPWGAEIKGTKWSSNSVSQTLTFPAGKETGGDPVKVVVLRLVKPSRNPDAGIDVGFFGKSHLYSRDFTFGEGSVRIGETVRGHALGVHSLGVGGVVSPKIQVSGKTTKKTVPYLADFSSVGTGDLMVAPLTKGAGDPPKTVNDYIGANREGLISPSVKTSGPALTGPTCVPTSFFSSYWASLGQYIFCGTSAASPTVGGVIAQAKGIAPSIPVDKLREYLLDTAGTASVENPYVNIDSGDVMGHGLVDAGKFVQKVAENATAANLSDLNVEPTHNSLTAKWAASENASGYHVVLTARYDGQKLADGSTIAAGTVIYDQVVTDTSVTINDLEPYFDYTISVTPINRWGYTGASPQGVTQNVTTKKLPKTDLLEAMDIKYKEETYEPKKYPGTNTDYMIASTISVDTPRPVQNLSAYIREAGETDRLYLLSVKVIRVRSNGTTQKDVNVMEDNEKYLPFRPAKPTVTIDSVTDSTITMTSDKAGTEVQYAAGSVANASPIKAFSDGQNHTITGLSPATRYQLRFRLAATDTEFASSYTDAKNQYTAYKTPEVGEGYTVDYVKETVTAKDGYKLVGVAESLPGSSFQVVRKDDTNDIPDSAATTNTLPERPETPDPPTQVSARTNTVTVSGAGEYQLEGREQITTRITFAGLQPGTEYKARTRVPASQRDSRFRSEWSDYATIGTQFKTPVDGEGYSIDYKNETISADEDHELEDSGESVVPGSTRKVRHRAEGARPASEYFEIQVKDRPATPDAPTRTTVFQDSMTVTMSDRIRVSGDSKNAEQTDALISGLKPATQYTIATRKDATDTEFASLWSADAKFYTRFATPGEGEGYTINYGAETITAKDGYSLDSVTGDLPGSTRTIKHIAVGDIPESLSYTFTVKQRPDTPAKPTRREVSQNSMKVTKSDTLRFKKADSTEEYVSQPGDVLSELSPETAYAMSTRKEATADEFASLWSDDAKFYTAYATPALKEGYTVDFINETVTANPGYVLSELPAEIPGASFTVMRKDASNDIPDSAATTNTLPARPETPKAPEQTAADTSSVTVNGSSEFQREGESEQTSNVFTGLAAGTEYQARTRVAASQQESRFHSEWSPYATIGSQFATPTVDEGYTIDYRAETIAVGSDYELEKAGETVVPGVNRKIRHKAAGARPASEYFEIQVKDRPETPAVPTRTDVTQDSLTVTKSDRIRVSGDSKNAEQTDALISDLKPATEYTIATRKDATDTEFASLWSADAKFYTRFATPGEGEGYTINYGAETITADQGYSLDSTEGELPGSTRKVKHAAQGDIPESAEFTFTVKNRPATPAKPVVSDVTDVSAKFVGSDELRLDSVTTAAERSDLTPATRYTVDTRIAATATDFASLWSDATEFYTAFKAPEVGEGFTVDFENEKVTAKEGYELVGVAESLPGSSFQVVKKGDTNIPDSAATENTLPARPETPKAPEQKSATPDSITVEGASEFQLENGTIQQNSRFENLQAGTEYQARTRVAAIAGQSFRSEWSPYATIGSQFATPVVDEGYEINYRAETIAVDSDYELEDPAEAVVPGVNRKIRHKAQGARPASEYFEIQVKDRPATPDAPTRTTVFQDSMTVTKSDTLRYKLADSAEDYTSQSGDVLSGLSPQTAYVMSTRKEATTDEFASLWSDDAKFYTRFATPGEGEGYTIDYRAETIKAKDGYSLDSDTGVLPGSTRKVKHDADGDIPESAEREFTVKQRPQTPAKPVVSDVTDVAAKFAGADELRLNGETTAAERTDLNPATRYTVDTRIAATATDFASLWSDAPEFYTAQKTPDVGEGFTVDFENEKVTAKEGYELVGVADSLPGSSFQVVKKAAGNVPASAPTTNSLPARPETPKAPEQAAANTSSVTVSGSTEFQLENGAVQQNSRFENLQAGTEYQARTRVAAVKDKSFASEWSPFTTIGTQFATPKDGEGYSIDYKNETISADADYELKDSETTEVPGSKRYVRHKTVGARPASEYFEISVKNRPDTPAAPTKVASTASSLEVSGSGEFTINDGDSAQDNGKFENLTAAKEYGIRTRVAATDSEFASDWSDETKLSTNYAAPAENEGYTVDYINETVSAQPGYQLESTPTVVPGATIKVKRLANGEIGESTWTEITLASRPEAPKAPTAAEVSDTTMRLNGAGEYRMDEGPAQTDSNFEKLTAETAHQYQTRTPATATSFASEWSPKAELYTAFAAPAAGEGYTIDYVNEKVTAKDGYTVTVPDGALPGATIQVVKNAKDAIPASASTANVMPARPVAPAAPTVKATTTTTITVEGNDEYLREDEKNTNGLFEKLNPGTTYEFRGRTAATATQFASEWSAPTSAATNFEKPAAGEGYTIDYLNETITAKPGFEIQDLTGEIPGSERKIRRKADGLNAASEWTEFTVPDRPAAPVLSVKESSDSAITLSGGNEFRMDSGATQTDATFHGLEAGTSHTFESRLAATTDSFASEWAAGVFATNFAAPNGDEGININFGTEEVTPKPGYEIRNSTGEDAKPGETIEVRHAAVAPAGASGWTTVTLPSRPVAPGSVVGSFDDTVSYQYRLEGSTEWTTVTGKDAFDKLTPGRYEVRAAATADGYASDISILVVADNSSKDPETTPPSNRTCGSSFSSGSSLSSGSSCGWWWWLLLLAGVAGGVTWAYNERLIVVDGLPEPPEHGDHFGHLGRFEWEQLFPQGAGNFGA
ncbi:MAG: S8 family serine peptidase [Corynebacterium sp.]|nr:S8 family serine peptidase [Corynebacterium sp.]